jgi:uncharacterized DUF497 family protein
VRITFDLTKRDKTLSERGLDFTDAAMVFAGVTLDIEDTRKDYVKHGSSAMACWRAGWSSCAIRHVARIAMSSA